MELLEEHRGVLRGLFPKHQGTEIKTTGDGFLVEFASALAAARCAVEIQRALAECNRAQPAERQVRIRIGIHLGDVVRSAGDVHGDGVTEELLNVLAQVPGLHVPGRSSSFAFKGKAEDNIFRKVGEQLHVATVLEGSVRKAGDKLSITAQLIILLLLCPPFRRHFAAPRQVGHRVPADDLGLPRPDALALICATKWLAERRAVSVMPLIGRQPIPRANSGSARTAGMIVVLDTNIVASATF